MPIRNAIASLAVKDLTSATQWYERLLGRPPDSKPMPEVVEWKFESGGWLQVYQLPERAGKGSVTLAVTGLDQQIDALESAGIAAGEPMRNPKVNVLMIKDPDGNSIALAEALDPTMAR
jgi:predicted enzyme related to lactoylglutathione lyase